MKHWFDVVCSMMPNLHWYDVWIIAAYIYYSIIELSVRHYGKGSFWANIDAAIEDELRW